MLLFSTAQDVFCRWIFVSNFLIQSLQIQSYDRWMLPLNLRNSSIVLRNSYQTFFDYYFFLIKWKGCDPIKSIAMKQRRRKRDDRIILNSKTKWEKNEYRKMSRSSNRFFFSFIRIKCLLKKKQNANFHRNIKSFSSEYFVVDFAPKIIWLIA